MKKKVDKAVTFEVFEAGLGDLRREFKNLAEVIDEKARQYRDDVLNKMNETMGELAQVEKIA